MAVEGTVSRVRVDDEEIYFVFESRNGRLTECAIEYDEETDKLIVRSNDSIVGTI